ncbi:MAG: alpha/beta hydrolase, partial [Deltaproteobacteria bacterium]|nr:alpha/beta hydrolase [Deltaproteobacteria bacterium]
TDEVSGIYKDGKEIFVENGEIKKDIDITVSRNNTGKIEFPGELQIQDDFDTAIYTGGNGQVEKIYDEMFSSENAAAGWWAPSSFMKAYGANIYFAEQYDPGKIPVLFVHGAKGSPQDWVYFLIRLDRNRYQPWFFYYPSGMRLSLSSKILYEKMTDLQRKYGFNTICIAAHSMGGIVTRAMLTNHDFSKNINFVKLYITFATPWTGYTSADKGIKYAFKKLPSWYDLGRRSSFIKRVMRARLPSHVPYYLFYGKQDKVSKGAAIDERVFVEAKERFGFQCDHETILSDRDVFDQYDEILKKEL